MKSNSGFSLIEVTVSMLLVFGLALAVGQSLGTQKMQQDVMSSKLAMTTTLENLSQRLNSFDYTNRNFEAFRTDKLHMGASPTDQAAFAACTQNANGAGCLKFADQTNFPPIKKTEIVPLGRGINFQEDWTSAVQCTDASCTSFKVTVETKIFGDHADIESTDNFKALQSQRQKMLGIPERDYPLLAFLKKADRDFSCANNPENGPVIGLNPGNVSAKCGTMKGISHCKDIGFTPLAAFGGAYATAPKNTGKGNVGNKNNNEVSLQNVGVDNCEKLVSVTCAQGIGGGGFYAGDCKQPSGGEIKSYVTKDGNGVSQVLVCGPGGDCLKFESGVGLYSTNDILGELKKSDSYNQLMTTWKNEGVLVPPSNMNVDLGNGWGDGVPGAQGVIMTLIPGGAAIPPGATLMAGAVGTSGDTGVSAVFASAEASNSGSVGGGSPGNGIKKNGVATSTETVNPTPTQ